MSYYCTLADGRSEIKAVAATDDAIVLRNIRTVSRRVDILMRGDGLPYFEPQSETRTIYVSPELVNSALNTLRLADPLLEVTSITRNGTALTYGSEVVAYPSATLRPFGTLRITTTSKSWYGCDGCSSSYPMPIVEIAGTWGYHPDYVRAWRAASVTVAAINDSITTMVLTVTESADYSEVLPLSPGHLIKIDSEFMRVMKVDHTTKTITVLRGQNGSTAASHLITSTVYVWDVPYDLRAEVTRQAGLLYTRRGAYDQVAQNEVGTVIAYPQDLLRSLKAVVSMYMGE